jgi:hypothetical protein
VWPVGEGFLGVVPVDLVMGGVGFRRCVSPVLLVLGSRIDGGELAGL